MKIEIEIEYEAVITFICAVSLTILVLSIGSCMHCELTAKAAKPPAEVLK